MNPDLEQRIRFLALSTDLMSHADTKYSLKLIQSLIEIQDFLDANQIDGKIRVVESGRDCDGIQYAGKVHTIDATITAYEALDDEIGNWADGPYRLRLMDHAEANPNYESRDLVMEAHEDGHPHSITSRFP